MNLSDPCRVSKTSGRLGMALSTRPGGSSRQARQVDDMDILTPRALFPARNTTSSGGGGGNGNLKPSEEI